jgi:hypothetical protein
MEKKDFKINILSLGSDPEFFITRDGIFYPSCGIIGGTKEVPKPLKESGIEGLSIQEDNVAVEITTAPCTSKEMFVNNITNSIEYLPKAFPKEYELSLSKAASAYFDPKYLDTEQARTFGCDPDVDAYTGKLNEISDSAKTTNFRTCGGHVHIGIEGGKDMPKLLMRKFIKLLDLYLGVPSLVLDKDVERRKLYGKSGSFRYKPYGCEYRVLSNFWVFEPKLIAWVWDSVQRAAEHFNSNEPIDFRKVKMAIDGRDMEIVEMLIKDYKLNLVTV